MDYCQRTQQTLSGVIEDSLKELAEAEIHTEP
jgi:hypothetical protein